eukprot:CAMPEP_0115153794 /NCGR_PEP_ID=MMETSP0227-20121206/66924_1 /TAXON_ID=89957 /ORGANISM="Polarella glacialis, Strain CCMP 1383" /LENGTH=210 /DNA_ID=CAMNT_0002564573 /DNA_START=385 /DNA_END=1018 /DNA_ORIENTATION=-
MSSNACASCVLILVHRLLFFQFHFRLQLHHAVVFRFGRLDKAPALKQVENRAKGCRDGVGDQELPARHPTALLLEEGTLVLDASELVVLHRQLLRVYKADEAEDEQPNEDACCGEEPSVREHHEEEGVEKANEDVARGEEPHAYVFRRHAACDELAEHDGEPNESCWVPALRYGLNSLRSHCETDDDQDATENLVRQNGIDYSVEAEEAD